MSVTPNDGSTGTRRRWRAVALMALLALAVWLAGLVYFAASIPGRVRDRETATDAIVVLTGGSERLQTGLALLANGIASRLFVSGVHEEVELGALLASIDLAPEQMPSAALIACCIVLGHDAGNTAGNALETSAWMAKEKLRSLRLVTADYHMPRSLLEFRRVMPDIEIVPHPVFPAEVKRDQWWLWPGTASLMVSEYHKHLAALARTWFAPPPAAQRQ
ncbi:MAG: YdcF family protein [Dongiaceae bacterium]